MNNQRIIFSLFLLLAGFSLRSQTDSLPKDRFYRHTYENDFFVATDRYYTQGVYLEFIFPVFKKLILSHALIPLRPSRSGNAGTKIINYYGVSTERQGFTPTSIRHFGLPEPGERPYAALVYLTHSLVSLDPERKLRLTTRLNLGLMGPNLFGEEEQVYIHTKLHNLLPIGWEYQIENDYVVNYDLFIEKGLIDSKYLTLTGLAEARAGTLYDDLSGGGMIRVGYMQPYFNNLGITRQKNTQKFQCYLYLRAKAMIVGYNATMQGGMINHNSTYIVPESNIDRFVATGRCGIAISYKRLQLEYALAYITREYGKGLDHGWGRIGINVCF
ncbi:MAG: lipid A deacylase LpxR family protein [Bacteroidia bacterium]